MFFYFFVASHPVIAITRYSLRFFLSLGSRYSCVWSFLPETFFQLSFLLFFDSFLSLPLMPSSPLLFIHFVFFKLFSLYSFVCSFLHKTSFFPPSCPPYSLAPFIPVTPPSCFTCDAMPRRSQIPRTSGLARIREVRGDVSPFMAVAVMVTAGVRRSLI